jgi:hypothetical protein
MIPSPPIVLGPMEFGAFMLANAIIIFFCAPRLLIDLKRWRS